MIEDFDEIREVWAKEVGRAILAFGDIESFTYLFIDFFIDSPNTASRLFVARVKAIIDFLDRKRNLPNVILMIDTLNMAISLAETRNVIAHNAFEINLHEAANKTAVFIPRICHATERAKIITFDELIDFRIKAEKLGDQLHKILSEIGLTELLTVP